MSDSKILAKDYFGNDLNVGDEVVFMQKHYRGFMRGKILKLTPKTALIGHDETNTCDTDTRQDHNQIIKVVKQDKQGVVTEICNWLSKAEPNAVGWRRDAFEFVRGEIERNFRKG